MIRAVVEGDSMVPALAPGDRVIVWPTRRLRVGDVVVLHDPRDRRRSIIKRVFAIDGELVTVRGDNPAASTDSRTFGPAPVRSIRGRVIYRYHPAERAGRIRR